MAPSKFGTVGKKYSPLPGYGIGGTKGKREQELARETDDLLTFLQAKRAREGHASFSPTSEYGSDAFTDLNDDVGYL